MAESARIAMALGESGQREWGARAALFAASMFLVIAGAEAALRLTGLPHEVVGWTRIANTKGLEVRAGTVSLVCYPTNPRGYFHIDLRRPEDRKRYEAIGMRRMNDVVSMWPFAVETRYNSLVFRGPEFPPRRPGTRRVVVIGDSFTEGWGVDEEDAYPRVLERLLDATEPGRWEVLNCGRANADFPALYMSVFKKALALDPDVVVYGMVLNDPVRTGRLAARHPRLPGPPDPVRGLRILALAADDWRRYRLTRATTQWYRDLFSDDNFNGWADTKSYIRNMQNATEERGGAFVLALWPMLQGLEGRYPFLAAHDTVGRFCAKSGIRFHDLLGTFRGRSSMSLWVHEVDVHPNEVAHRLAAESLVDVVRAAEAGRTAPAAQDLIPAGARRE